MTILVLNGPNLNLLGKREPELYGDKSFTALLEHIRRYAASKGHRTVCFQSNREGALIEAIQQFSAMADGIIINAGAYTHTSVGLRDALLSVGLPAVEVHITDTEKREDFRKISYLRDACVATVAGEGTNGYLHAMDILNGYWEEKNESHH